MTRADTIDKTCGIARGLDLLGERWTGRVLLETLRGAERFSDLLDALGIAPDVLSSRLTKLVDAGVLERVPYQEDGRRAREKYVPTVAGQRLGVVLAALNDWAEAFLPLSSGEPGSSRFVEQSTGQVVHVALVTDDGRIVDDAAVGLAVTGS
jgi:DNA-binding HxlR family transcriptional regulator